MPGIVGIIAIIVTLLIHSTVTANASELPAKEAIVRVFTKSASFPSSLVLHSIKDYQAFEFDIVHNTTSRLVRFRGDTPSPELAESWRVSPDMLTYTFHLRRDRRYSNGKPILAEHVAYCIKRSIFRNGQFSAQYRNLILGSRPLKNLHESIPGIRVVDPDTIEIVLIKPARMLMAHLSMLTFSVFEPKDLDPDEDRLAPNYAASGAYKISSITNERVELELNPYHWRSKDRNIPTKIVILPADKRSSLERLETGEIDFALADLGPISEDYIKQNKLQNIVAGPLLTFLSLDFRGPFLSSLPQAAVSIHRLLDRDALVDFLSRTLGCQYGPAYSVTANIQTLQEEAKASRKMINKEKEIADFTKSLSLRVSKEPFTLAYPIGNAYRQAIAEQVAKQISEFGVPTRVIALPFAEITKSNRFGEFDAGITGHGIDGKTPADALQFLVGTDPSRSNLPSNHPIFSFYSRNADARTYEDHISLLKTYNSLIDDTGAIIPLLTSSYASIFSSRIGLGNIDRFEDRWPVYELRINP